MPTFGGCTNRSLSTSRKQTALIQDSRRVLKIHCLRLSLTFPYTYYQGSTIGTWPLFALSDAHALHALSFSGSFRAGCCASWFHLSLVPWFGFSLGFLVAFFHEVCTQNSWETSPIWGEDESFPLQAEVKSQTRVTLEHRGINLPQICIFDHQNYIERSSKEVKAYHCTRFIESKTKCVLLREEN